MEGEPPKIIRLRQGGSEIFASASKDTPLDINFVASPILLYDDVEPTDDRKNINQSDHAAIKVVAFCEMIKVCRFS